MTLAEAKVYLGLIDEADLEDVEEALEEKVFELKQIFLNRFVPPKLANARINKLKTLVGIGEVLLDWSQEDASVEEEEERPSGVKDFMDWHQKRLYGLKLSIAREANAVKLMYLLKEYKLHQLTYVEFWNTQEVVDSEVECTAIQDEPGYAKFVKGAFSSEDVSYEQKRVAKF